MVEVTTTPTRAQIAQLVGNDQRLILAMERLFEAGLTVDAVLVDIAALQSDVTVLQNEVSDAESDIATNTANIAANAAAIAAIPDPVYSILKANGNTASADIANTEAAIPWAAAEITSADVTVSGSELTIGSDGTYRITVALRVEGNNRVELFIRTYIDTGSGKVQDTAELVSNYALRDTTQDTGAVVLNTALELNDGDVLEFRGFADASGTCTMLDDGTRVIIERVL
jgi:hypothetical protein